MDITFRTRKLERTFNRLEALRKAYPGFAGAIMQRMVVLEAARNLAQVPTTPPDRRHRFGVDRDERFAVDLLPPYRLVFEAGPEPVPRSADGGIDTERVTAITILDVVGEQ